LSDSARTLVPCGRLRVSAAARFAIALPADYPPVPAGKPAGRARDPPSIRAQSGAFALTPQATLSILCGGLHQHPVRQEMALRVGHGHAWSGSRKGHLQHEMGFRLSHQESHFLPYRISTLYGRTGDFGDMTGPHRDRSGTPTATISNTGNHPERPARRRPMSSTWISSSCRTGSAPPAGLGWADVLTRTVALGRWISKEPNGSDAAAASLFSTSTGGKRRRPTSSPAGSGARTSGDVC
jgi:hypothetical protein